MEDRAVVTPPYLAGPLRLHPFPGLMLAASRIGDPGAARLFARPYRDVAGRLSRWREQGQLLADDEPAVYLHEYTSGGITVRGLVGALELGRTTDTPTDGVVLPHEGIHPVQVDELATRMSQMQLDPAPILLVHRARAEVRDLLARVQADPPGHAFTDRGEQQHRLWAIRGPADLALLDAALQDGQALIADGHHRFAAYQRMRAAQPGGARDLGLVMLVDQDDTPLFLGAIHRVLDGTCMADLRTAAARIGAGFDPHSAGEAVAALGPAALVVTDGEEWATIRLDVPAERAAVEMLHEDLLPRLERPPDRVRYLHTVEDALTLARPAQTVAVLLPAIDFDQLLRIVASGRLLPEKATSFQPKPHVGVLLRSLRDG